MNLKYNTPTYNSCHYILQTGVGISVCLLTTSVPLFLLSALSPLHAGRQWPRPVCYVHLGLWQLASVTTVDILLVSKECFGLSLWRHRPTNSVILTSEQRRRKMQNGEREAIHWYRCRVQWVNKWREWTASN
jgi:hypothetical protein